jgi:hypothetical protein
MIIMVLLSELEGQDIVPGGKLRREILPAAKILDERPMTAHRDFGASETAFDEGVDEALEKN